MRLYFIIGAALALLGAFGATGWFSFNAGKNSERAANAVIIEEGRAEERAKVKEVIEYRDKIKVVYRDKIRAIRETKGAADCADRPLVDMGFRLYDDN